jgi:hypothetical protein
MHARRKFVDAVKVNPNDPEAVKMVVRMDALFVVDREARTQDLTGAQRLALRREHAQPWVEEIREACLKVSRQALPQSGLGQAAAYTLNMWEKLKRCFEYGEVELSNTWRRTRCGRWRWAARTGCTWAVLRLDPGWRRFCRLQNRAVGCVCR